jgi:hypothetical protein
MDKLAEKADFLNKILDRNLYWIGAADTKATLLFAIMSAMLAVLVALVPCKNQWTFISTICFSISALILLAGIAFIIFASFPRLKGPRNSLVYFGGIASHDENHYIQKVIVGLTDEFLIDLAKQCHRNAEIAKSKYECIRYANISLFASLVFWLISIAILYPVKFAK